MLLELFSILAHGIWITSSHSCTSLFFIVIFIIFLFLVKYLTICVFQWKSACAQALSYKKISEYFIMNYFPKCVFYIPVNHIHLIKLWTSQVYYLWISFCDHKGARWPELSFPAPYPTHVLKTTPSVMVFGDGAFVRSSGLDEVMRVVPAFKQRHQRYKSLPLPLSPLSQYMGTKERACEHTARWQPPTSHEKRPQSETHLAGTLVLDVPASITVGKQISIV